MFGTELLPEFHADLISALSNLKSDNLPRHIFLIGRTRVSWRGNTLFEKNTNTLTHSLCKEMQMDEDEKGKGKREKGIIDDFALVCFV